MISRLKLNEVSMVPIDFRQFNLLIKKTLNIGRLVLEIRRLANKHFEFFIVFVILLMIMRFLKLGGF